ncbi:MAG: ATP-binding cassette domain-containing protein, partial [Chloroflexota bacterium]|nr:ATP-binding cassette domain-containing protein [Chloroflexota bacterium]
LEAVGSEKSGGNFNLKMVERTGNNVLTTEDLAVGYGDKVLAGGINISLHRGGVLGVIGGNGTGKTTLLKTLLGQIREIDGKIHWGTKTNIGYYSQTLDDLYAGNDVLNELRRVSPTAESVALRSFLARFLFFGEEVDKKVATLSGGEKGRLALAKLIYSQKNVLILDEPTNHLDITSQEVLQAVLDAYQGTILLVSHDRYLIDALATQIWEIDPDESHLSVFNGTYSQMKEERRKEEERVAIQQMTTPDSRNPNIEAKRARSKETKEERRRVAQLQELENTIAEFEAKMASLSSQLESPFVKPEEVRKIGTEYERLQKEMDAKLAEWEGMQG